MRPVYGLAMTRLRALTRSQLSDEQGALWDAVVDGRGAAVQSPAGGLIGPFNAFVHVPEIGRRLLSLGGHLRFGTSIERRLTEVAICTVGAHWQSEFEFWAHAPMAIEHGVDAAAVDALREGRQPDFERDDERVAHDIATQLLNDRRVDDATYSAGEDLLGEAGLVELVTLIGYYCLISMTLNLFEVALPEGQAAAWGP
jgi:4-carboxymuconolactone decarboxylase